MNVRAIISAARISVISVVLFLVALIGQQARADVVSSICAPDARYFELRTFQAGEESHLLESRSINGLTFSIANLATWLKKPVQCTIKNIIGYSHSIEVRAVDYTPGSNAMCGAEENATIEIFLDGELFDRKEDVYGSCQPMDTLIEFNAGALFFCSFPDLAAITGAGDTPQWTMEHEAKGDISMECKKIDIFVMDANKNQSQK